MPQSLQSLILRPATLADAAEVANVHVHSWREAYSGILPAEVIADLPLTFKGRLNLWSSVLAGAHSDAVYVAVAAEHGIVGFAAVGQPRDLFAGQNLGELKAMYLLRAYHRRGIAAQLLQLGFADLRQRGYAGAYCWVLSDNPARFFYQKTGAKLPPDKVKQETIGGQVFSESCCVWSSI